MSKPPKQQQIAQQTTAPIGELRPNPRNPRKHPEEQINRLMASLRRAESWAATRHER